MTNQSKTNNLDYLVDPRFNKINRLFENQEDRACISKYYTLKVEIKDFNALINGKIFLMCQ